MSFSVRVFGYRGIRNFPRVSWQQKADDSVNVLEEPYEWRQLLSVNGTIPPAFTTVNPDAAQILRVEVPEGQAIRYELNSPGRNVVADGASPKQVGDQNYPWGPGWSISIVDAASYP
jgi:hypothetical protein